MHIGVNCDSPHTLPMINELAERGVIDFCELMVDNFAHLPAEDIVRALPNIPLALHIVASRFLEKDEASLTKLASYLRPWIKSLNPIYVSDHLVNFTFQNERLPFPIEVNYENEAMLMDQIEQWANLLEVDLLLENHASLTNRGKQQPQFYSSLLKNRNINLLFDFSNAYIAESNEICTRDKWLPLMSQVKHFHVAGFSRDKKTAYLLDTHDQSMSDPVIEWVKDFMKVNSRDKSLVLEFDHLRSKKQIEEEIQKFNDVRY